MSFLFQLSADATVKFRNNSPRILHILKHHISSYWHNHNLSLVKSALELISYKSNVSFGGRGIIVVNCFVEVFLKRLSCLERKYSGGSLNFCWLQWSFLHWLRSWPSSVSHKWLALADSSFPSDYRLPVISLPLSNQELFKQLAEDWF